MRVKGSGFAHVGYCLAVEDVIALVEDDELAEGRSLAEYRQMLREYHAELSHHVARCNDPGCSISKAVEDMTADAEKDLN